MSFTRVRGNTRPKRVRRGPRVGSKQMISHPPQIGNYLMKHTTRLRFVCSGGFNGAITFQNLLDTILIATGSTAGSDLFQRVRIRAVEVWSIAAVGTAASCSVQFNNATTGFIGDSKFHTDTSMGIEPAHVKASPTPLSMSALFQQSSSNTAFTLECTNGSVVDVSLTFEQVNAAQVSTANVLVAATAGTLYFRGLDGLATASTAFTPPSNLAIQ